MGGLAGAVDVGGVAETVGDALVLFTNGAHAGTGGRNYVVNRGICEGIRIRADHAEGFLLVAGIDVHLAAAGLFFREDHFVAQAGENQCRCLLYVREKGVTNASGK